MNLQTPMFRDILFLLKVTCFLLLMVKSTPAIEMGSLKGKVVDGDDRPIKGAVIAIYFDDTAIRKKPDFMTMPTDVDGRFSMNLPPGTYYALARAYEQNRRTGPLALTGKYSGDPITVEIKPNSESVQEFVVLDIKDIAKQGLDLEHNLIKVQGTIRNKKGKPVINAYVFANRKNRQTEFPDYITTWSNESGDYTLYVPAGKYYLGSAASFPPKIETRTTVEVVLEKNQSDLDIVFFQKDTGAHN